MLAQTGRAFSFTGSPCSSAAGSAASAARAEREVKQKFTPLGPSVTKVLNFSPSFQENVKKKWHTGRHVATVTRRLSTETRPCSSTSPPVAPTARGGHAAASQMSSVSGAAILPPSRKLPRATLILPCLPGRAKQMPLCLFHPPSGSDTLSKCSPPGPFWPGGGREQTQNPTSTRELISLF